MAGIRLIRSASAAADRPGFAGRHQPGHARVARRGGSGDPAEHELDPVRDRAQDVPCSYPRRRLSVAVTRGDQLEPLGGLLSAVIAPERNAVPGHERELEQRRGRPGQVPVEDAGERVPVEAGVVRRDVVVPDQRGLGDGKVPPGSRVAEPGHRPVERVSPADQRDDLAGAQYLGVDVDNPARQVAQHLPVLPVVPENPRDSGYPAVQAAEQRVDRRGPGSGLPPHRAADPHRPADVAARQPHLRIAGLAV